MSGPRVLPAGETALVVEYGRTADRSFHDRVLALDAALARSPVEGIIETVPTYRSLMVHFDPRVVTYDALVGALAEREGAAPPRQTVRRWRMPACYDGCHGEDLAEVAGLTGFAPDRIAELHSGATYRAVMYGFAPGFLFLDGLPDELRVSRRQSPRPPAQSGALTIANGQALIASVAMPTGWYVLGRTPARTFDPRRDPAFPIAVGDEVVFERVAPDRFDALLQDAERGAPIMTAAAV